MRNIKYRAYRKDRKQMLRITSIRWIERADYVVCTYLPALKDYPEEIEVKKKDLKQYTGLKDDKETPIFEDDILKYQDISSDKYLIRGLYTTGVVKWVQGDCGFLPQDIEENFKGGHYFCHWSDCKNREVIGNICENPELAED